MSIFDDLRQKYFKIYKDNDKLDDEYEEGKAKIYSAKALK